MRRAIFVPMWCAGFVGLPTPAPALAGAGNRQVTVRAYPEANHLFQQAVTDRPSKYAPRPKMFVAGLDDDLAAWTAAR